MNYDYIIVGAGITGLTLANILKSKQRKVLVIEKRNIIGGNCSSGNWNGIDIHLYGPHVINTDNEDVLKFLNSFHPLRQYHHRAKAKIGNNIYSFPINLMTLHQIYGVTTPEEAKILLEDITTVPCCDNLEEYGTSIMGNKLYRMFIHGYTKKQWGVEPKLLPCNILQRLPIRTTYNDAYYKTKHHVLPEDSYQALFEAMSKNIEVKLDCNYLENKNEFNKLGKIIYTGRIDEYHDFVLGELPYRCLKFKHELLDIEDFQGLPVMHYPEENIKYTRITEHKHYLQNPSNLKKTWITYEIPTKDGIPSYPINTIENNKLRIEYSKLDNTIFAGRLGRYLYLNMDQAIEDAIRIGTTL